MADWIEAMEWGGTCTEPSTELKASGYSGGDNPCAEHENYFRNCTYACIVELQNEFENYAQTGETLAAIVRQYTTNTPIEVEFTAGEEGELYYYDSEGNMVTGTYYINGVPYLFANAGVLETGFQTVDGLRYYYDPTTGQMQTGFVEYGGNTYYITLSEGKYVSRTETIDGVEYTFDDDGILSYATIATESVGSGVIATLYANGDIMVTGSGAVTTRLSVNFCLQAYTRLTSANAPTVTFGSGITSICTYFTNNLLTYYGNQLYTYVPEIQIPASVDSIGSLALCGVVVNYSGTVSNWKKITNDSSGSAIDNGIFWVSFDSDDVRIYCSDGTLKWDSDSSAWEEV